MYCECAYIEDGKIKCSSSGYLCANVKFCEITRKWRQTENAKRCPGNPGRKDSKNGTA